MPPPSSLGIHPDLWVCMCVLFACVYEGVVLSHRLLQTQAMARRQPYMTRGSVRLTRGPLSLLLLSTLSRLPVLSHTQSPSPPPPRPGSGLPHPSVACRALTSDLSPCPSSPSLQHTPIHHVRIHHEPGLLFYENSAALG